MLYVEYVAGSLHVEDQAEVNVGKLMFDRLRAEALSPAGSVELIERLASEVHDP